MSARLQRGKRILAVYAALPEMRLFWILLPLSAILTSISFFYMPLTVSYASAGLFIFVLVIVFINNLRLAKSNLEVKVERNELSSIVNNLQDGIIAYDTDFKVIVFNRAAEIIFGVSTKEIVGTIYSPNAVKSSRSVLLSQVIFPSLAPMSVTRSDSAAAVQVVDLSFEEPKLELRVSTVKIIDPAGKLLGFLKIIQNRTREVEILRSKSDFITVAAHQLRTPLSGIEWAFETLAKEPGLNTESKEFVVNGGRAAEAVLKIVNDMLDVSKIEEGKFGYQFQEIDLVAFLEKVLNEAVFFAQKYSIGIFFEKPSEARIMITVDPQKLALVMNNLIDNAIKYNVKNGSVTVKLEKISISPYVQISVSDTGLGISAEDLPKLFKKFFRAESALKIETTGSGLGLFIAKNIVLRHGGRIAADSELNRGTTISFTLPTDPALIPKQEISGKEE